MNRLTYKLDDPIKTKYLNYEYKRISDYDIDRCNFGRITDDMIFNKLGKLEDIEEELGIDLLTLFKVINGSVFVKCWDGSIDEVEATIGYVGNDCVLQFNDMMDNDHKCYYPYTTKDYGVTWSLTREELEND